MPVVLMGPSVSKASGYYYYYSCIFCSIFILSAAIVMNSSFIAIIIIIIIYIAFKLLYITEPAVGISTQSSVFTNK